MAEFGTRSVTDREWATSRTSVYVDDLDEHCERSRAAGAIIIAEPGDLGPNRIYLASNCGAQQWIFATPIASREATVRLCRGDLAFRRR